MRGSGRNAKGRRGVLDAIERVGNALPDPVLLFVGLIVIVMAVSAGTVGDPPG
jgi:p-aminobenzoyl-glutamate transporter AbgT